MTKASVPMANAPAASTMSGRPEAAAIWPPCRPGAAAFARTRHRSVSPGGLNCVRDIPARQWSAEGRLAGGCCCPGARTSRRREHGYDLVRWADSVVVTPSLVKKLR